MRNSEEEYNEVYKKLDDDLFRAQRELEKLQKNAPKSKYDIIEPIRKTIKKAQAKAEQELMDYLEREKQRCRCSGYYCEC